MHIFAHLGVLAVLFFTIGPMFITVPEFMLMFSALTLLKVYG